MVIPPITLLVGKELVLREEHIRRIRESLFSDPSGASLNFHRFDAAEHSLAEILNPSHTAPFLADKRLVVVDNVESFKDEDRRQLLEVLEPATKYAAWILMTSERSTKTSFLNNIASMSDVKFCDVPYQEGEVRQWVHKRFAQWHKKCSNDAVNDLLDRVGKSMTRLDQACEQLSLYAAERPEITSDDVNALLGQTAEQNVFDLYEALKLGQHKTAHRILHQLHNEGKRASEILGSLVWQFERILRVKNLLVQGFREADVAQKMRIHPFFAKKTVAFASRFSKETIERDLEVLLESDRRIKRGQMREELALELCALNLSAGV